MGDIYDIATYQPKKSVGYLLTRVRVEMLAALDRELAADKRLAPLEISSAQFVVVATLAASSAALSASDLCKGISYDAGAMTRMMDRLESKGLIRRTRSTQDRRLMYLELTEEGRAVSTDAGDLDGGGEPFPARLHHDRGTTAGGAARPHVRERADGGAARDGLTAGFFQGMIA